MVAELCLQHAHISSRAATQEVCTCLLCLLISICAWLHGAGEYAVLGASGGDIGELILGLAAGLCVCLWVCVFFRCFLVGLHSFMLVHSRVEVIIAIYIGGCQRVITGLGFMSVICSFNLFTRVFLTKPQANTTLARAGVCACIIVARQRILLHAH